MFRVELIYGMDCPNIEHARRALLEGFNEARYQPSWTEWDRKSPESPNYVRDYGSPTILVNGRDVMGAEPVAGTDSCRLYDQGAGKLSGLPPVQSIASALRVGGPSTCEGGSGPGWWRALASLPGVGAALLPVVGCPACWAAATGILGSLGVGVLLESTYLLPITIGFLSLALFALAFRARARRGYGPLMLGIASVGIVLAFKFVYAFNPVVYAGLFGLVAASVWNAWPISKPVTGSCPRCVPQQPDLETKNAP